jgi:hypothetical protein
VNSLVAVPNDGTVTEVMEYHVPVPEIIRPGSVKLILGVKLIVVEELLNHVTTILSPEVKFLEIPVIP